MLKALLKKQFMELNAYYFQDKRTGEIRTKAKTALFIGLFALIFIGLGSTFYFIASALCAPLIEADKGWLYYAIMGLIALALGLFGSVFNTYSGLYRAKDNEFLLSLPIPPSKILFVRIIGVVAMSFLYEAIVFIPALIARFAVSPLSFGGVVFSILIMLVLAVFISILSCALGYVVALIAGKLKNKSIVVVILSLVFIAVYYYVYSQAFTFMESLIAQIGEVGTVVKNWLYPFYIMGMACEGNVLSFLAFTVGVFALFVLCYFILSKSFIKIVTVNKGEGKVTVKREENVKVSGVKTALFKRELKHYLSSPTYMLNCSLGTIFLIALAVLAIIKKSAVDDILLQLSGMLPNINSFIVLVIALLICLVVTMNDLTAPSVSLEGKKIWLIRSLPVKTSDVLNAKQHLHYALTMPPALIATVTLCIVVGAGFAQTLMTVAFVMAFIMFSSASGLMLNLLKPNLNWSTETVAVKQGIAVLIALLGGWLVIALVGVLYFLCAGFLAADDFMLIFIVIFALLTGLINRWICGKGAVIFENLK